MGDRWKRSRFSMFWNCWLVCFWWPYDVNSLALSNQRSALNQVLLNRKGREARQEEGAFVFPSSFATFAPVAVKEILAECFTNASTAQERGVRLRACFLAVAE